MLGAESLPALTRTKTNRGNAYLRPDASRDGAKFILPSFDCNHSGEKGPTNTPGCRVQEDVPFEGLSQRFPQVQPGAARRPAEVARRLSAPAGLDERARRGRRPRRVGRSSRSSSGCRRRARSSTRARRSPSPPAAARWRRCSSPGSPGSAVFLTALGDDDDARATPRACCASASASRSMRRRAEPAAAHVHVPRRRRRAHDHGARRADRAAARRTRCRGTRWASWTGSTSPAATPARCAPPARRACSSPRRARWARWPTSGVRLDVLVRSAERPRRGATSRACSTPRRAGSSARAARLGGVVDRRDVRRRGRRRRCRAAGRRLRLRRLVRRRAGLRARRRDGAAARRSSSPRAAGRRA